MLQRLRQLRARVRGVVQIARDVLDTWEAMKLEVQRHKRELDLVFSESGVGNWRQYDQEALKEKPARSVEINDGRTFAEERALIRR